MLLCSTQYCFRALMLPFLNKGLQQATTNLGILAYHHPFGKPPGSLLSLLSGLPSFSVQLKPLPSSFILRFSWATRRKCVCLISFLSEKTHVLYSLKTALNQNSHFPEHSGSQEMSGKQKQLLSQASFTPAFHSCKQIFEWCYGQ